MNSNKKLVSLSLALIMTGCATASKDVATSYISPLQYKGYDCDQVAEEQARLQNRITQLGGRLDQAASNDKALTGVGMLLFWPALFALGGTKEQEAEYARIKGEHEALNQVSIQKKCAFGGTTVATTPVAAPAAATPVAEAAVATPESLAPAPATATAP